MNTHHINMSRTMGNDDELKEYSSRRYMSIFSSLEKLEMMERIYRRLQQNQDFGDSIHDVCCGKSNPNKRRDRIYGPPLFSQR